MCRVYTPDEVLGDPSSAPRVISSGVAKRGNICHAQVGPELDEGPVPHPMTSDSTSDATHDVAPPCSTLERSEQKIE